MAWKRSPEWLVEAFGELVPKDPRVERRKMFGYPCAFAGGNMFIGLHEERLVLRLPDAARDELRAATGAAPFEPFEGREMKQYSVIPEPLVRERSEELRRWIRRSLRYAAEELPAKPPKASTSKPRHRK